MIFKFKNANTQRYVVIDFDNKKYEVNINSRPVMTPNVTIEVKTYSDLNEVEWQCMAEKYERVMINV